MIKNDRQYQKTKNLLSHFAAEKEEIEKRYGADAHKAALLAQGYVDQVEKLKTELKEYEKMKKTAVPAVVRIRDLSQISRTIVRLRLAQRLTQKQLADLIGCKQADISRMEREGYRGYTVGQIEKVMEKLGRRVEIEAVAMQQ
ncbi:MAG: helix-turn-helix domain-containing protein [Candidatus Omnitrophica bacterium]|nr:helix-turn-helix domain-containing protein [Candidatus Omnitrophota bacterium]